MSWNRIYRPTKIEDLHLEHVRAQMQTMLEAGYFPQAMLFAGPKGTGKTSTSRIIGAILNDSKNEHVVRSRYLSKNKDTKKDKLTEAVTHSTLKQQIFTGTSYVVQEMDAASNRGIDDIRALKERVMLPPQEGLMSVYILDEAHMLTTEAFNALLKLLEEPPAHVVFILATTELHKIPETITSRCQVVHFRQATTSELVAALKKVATQEKLSITDSALDRIAQLASGSFRDAIKVLELVSQSGTKITDEHVTSLIGASSRQEIEDLLNAIIHRDETVVVQIFEQLRERHVDPGYFYKSLLQFLHLELITALKLRAGEPLFAKNITQFLLTELLDPAIGISSPIPHLPLELKILSLIDRSKKNNPKPTNSKTSSSTKSVTKAESKTETVAQKSADITDLLINALETQPATDGTMITVDSVGTDLAPGDGQLLCDKWNQLISEVTHVNSGLAALLRSAKPISGSPGQAKISVFYKFHQEQLQQPKFATLIHQSVLDIAGGYVQLEFVLTETPTKADLVELQSKISLSQVATEVLM